MIPLVVEQIRSKTTLKPKKGITHVEAVQSE